jgi:hypothetical protein
VCAQKDPEIDAAKTLLSRPQSAKQLPSSRLDSKGAACFVSSDLKQSLLEAKVKPAEECITFEK